VKPLATSWSRAKRSRGLLVDHQVAFEGVGARAGDLGDALKLAPAVAVDQLDVVEGLEEEGAGLAVDAGLDVEGVVGADGCALPGDGGGEVEQLFELGLEVAELRLEVGELLGDLLALLDQRGAFLGRGLGRGLGVGVALGLQGLGSSLKVGDFAVEGQEFVEVERAALVLEGLAHEFGVFADELDVKHGGVLRSTSYVVRQRG